MYIMSATATAALPDPEVVLLTEVITHAFSRTSWTSEYLDVVVRFGGCMFGWLPSVVNFKKAWRPNKQNYEYLCLLALYFLWTYTVMLRNEFRIF